MSKNLDLDAYCRELDSTLKREKVRPEEVDRRIALLRPLEKLVSDLAAPPEDLNSEAGRIAQSQWYSLHPKKADFDRLFNFLSDNCDLVRLSASEAIVGSLDIASGAADDPSLPKRAKQSLYSLLASETSPLIAQQYSRILKDLEKKGRPRIGAQSRIRLNPYVAGLPVHGDKFVGRFDVLNKIENSLTQIGVRGIVLYGARRTGKTSVLYKLRDGALGSGYFCVYADMQAFAGASLNKFVSGLTNIIDEEARKQPWLAATELPPVSNKEMDLFAFREYLHQLLIGLRPTSLVLLFDEFEVIENIIAGTDVSRQFESIFEAEGNIFAIAASARKIESLNRHQLSTLLDSFAYLKLSFLDKEDAVQLIRKPAEDALKFSDEAVDQILALTGGHPFYIQWICQSVFEVATATGEYIVESKHVEEAVELFMKNPSPHIILTWNGLDFANEATGVALANTQPDRNTYISADNIALWLKQEQFPVPFRASEIEHSLVVLRDIDWVEKQHHKNAYRWTMELVRRWIIENRSIGDLAEKHIQRIFAGIPSYWRQRGATIADLIIFSLLVWITFVSTINFFKNEIAWSGVFGIDLVVYFVIPILLGRSTLGMQLGRLKVVHISTRPLSNWRAGLYGFTLSIRWAIQALFLTGFIALITAPLTLRDLAISFLVITTLVLITLDNMMVVFGRRRRGLYEKLTGALLVPAGIVRE